MVVLERHTGRSIPVLRQSLSPEDTEWLICIWDDRIGSAVMSLSEWKIPDEFEAVGYAHGAEMTVNEIDYFAANGVLVDVRNAPVGIYTVSNKITLADGRTYERSFRISVKPL